MNSKTTFKEDAQKEALELSKLHGEVYAVIRVSRNKYKAIQSKLVVKSDCCISEHGSGMYH